MIHRALVGPGELADLCIYCINYRVHCFIGDWTYEEVYQCTQQDRGNRTGRDVCTYGCHNLHTGSYEKAQQLTLLV